MHYHQDLIIRYYISKLELSQISIVQWIRKYYKKWTTH